MMSLRAILVLALANGAAAFAPFASRCGIREGGRFPGLTPALVEGLAPAARSG